MNIEEIIKLAEELNLVEKFDPKETKKPTENDLDDIFDAINTLNKAEWFCKNEKDVNVLYKAQNILKQIKSDAEGLLDDIEEE